MGRCIRSIEEKSVLTLNITLCYSALCILPFSSQSRGLINLQSKRIFGPGQIRFSFLCYCDANTAHVCLKPFIEIPLQGIPHVLSALRRKEPRPAAKIVFVRRNQRQNLVEAVVRKAIY